MVETVANIRGNKSRPDELIAPIEHKCSGGKGSLMRETWLFHTENKTLSGDWISYETFKEEKSHSDL